MTLKRMAVGKEKFMFIEEQRMLIRTWLIIKVKGVVQNANYSVYNITMHT
jgi:hypothetical protein